MIGHCRIYLRIINQQDGPVQRPSETMFDHILFTHVKPIFLEPPSLVRKNFFLFAPQIIISFVLSILVFKLKFFDV